MDKENTAIKKTQEEITESVLKKMWGEKACTRKVSIEGEKKPMTDMRKIPTRKERAMKWNFQ